MGKKKVKYMVKLSDEWDSVASIWPVEIERETPKCVWVNGNRKLKRSTYENFYNSFKEAKDALLEAQEIRVERLQGRLKMAESILNDIRELSPDAK